MVLHRSFIPGFAARELDPAARARVGLDPAGPRGAAPVALDTLVDRLALPRRALPGSSPGGDGGVQRERSDPSAMPDRRRPPWRRRVSDDDVRYWASTRGACRGRAGWIVTGRLPEADLRRLDDQVTIASIAVAEADAEPIDPAGSADRWRPTFATLPGASAGEGREDEISARFPRIHAPAAATARFPRSAVRCWNELPPGSGADAADGDARPRFSDDLGAGVGAGGTPAFLNLQLAAHLGLNPIHLIGDGGAGGASPEEAQAARAWADAAGVRILDARRESAAAFERVDAEAVLPPEGASVDAVMGSDPPAPSPRPEASEEPARPAARRGARVVVFMRNTAAPYAGGRYHAWWLVMALVRLGHRVDVVTNARPGFWHELPVAEREAADLHLHPRLRPPKPLLRPAAPERADLVLVVPFGTPDADADRAAVALAKAHDARLALLNFESPNWFNALAPVPRRGFRWDGWRYIASHADLVLSSAAESTRFARTFYDDGPASTLFRHVGPPLNDAAADAAMAAADGEAPGVLEADGPRPAAAQAPGGRVVCITRFAAGHAHKGGGDLARLMGPELAGAELALVVGRGGVPAEVSAGLDAAAAAAGMSWSLHEGIDDRAKFELLHNGGHPAVLAFPSLFEGFGYPPLEALYLGVPAVAYHLPVLDEVGGGLIATVPPGDADALRRAAAAALVGGRIPVDSEALADLRDRLSLDGFARRLGRVLDETLTMTAPPGVRDADPSAWPRRRNRSGSGGGRPGWLDGLFTKSHPDGRPTLYIRSRRLAGRVKRSLGGRTSLSGAV